MERRGFVRVACGVILAGVGRLLGDGGRHRPAVSNRFPLSIPFGFAEPVMRFRYWMPVVRRNG
jgi:hypothetical protein